MKKTLVVMMAFVLGLAITSCKQAPKAAEAAETTEAAAADPVQALTELVEKAKADGSKWTVDEWKDAFKVAMTTVAPALKEIAEITANFQAKEGEQPDTAKISEALEKMKVIQEKFAPFEVILDQFDSIAKSCPNGKAVSDDREFEAAIKKELGIPDL